MGEIMYKFLLVYRVLFRPVKFSWLRARFRVYMEYGFGITLEKVSNIDSYDDRNWGNSKYLLM